MGVEIELVVNIVVPDEHVVAKMLGRRACDLCGRSYNLADVHDDKNGVYMPPILPRGGATTHCECGGALVSRTDDTATTIEERLRVYYTETAPLVEHYRSLGVLVNYRVARGLGDLDQLTAELQTLVGAR